MANSGGVITAKPVRLMQDVHEVLGVAGGLGYVITNADIKKWNANKPMRYNTLTELTSAQKIAANYGMSITKFSTISAFAQDHYSNSNDYWAYLKPRGLDYDEPFRLLDFLYYDSTMVCPHTTSITKSGSTRIANCIEKIIAGSGFLPNEVSLAMGETLYFVLCVTNGTTTYAFGEQPENTSAGRTISDFTIPGGSTIGYGLFKLSACYVKTTLTAAQWSAMSGTELAAYNFGSGKVIPWPSEALGQSFYTLPPFTFILTDVNGVRIENWTKQQWIDASTASFDVIIQNTSTLKLKAHFGTAAYDIDGAGVQPIPNLDSQTVTIDANSIKEYVFYNRGTNLYSIYITFTYSLGIDPADPTEEFTYSRTYTRPA